MPSCADLLCVWEVVFFFPPTFLSLLLKSFSSLMIFSLFYVFPPKGEITNPQKAEWHVLKRWTKYKYLKMYFMVIMSGFMALAQY